MCSNEGSPKGPGQTGGLSFGTFLWPSKEKYGLIGFIHFSCLKGFIHF